MAKQQKNKIKKEKSVQKSVYIKPKINTMVVKYIAKNRDDNGCELSYSSVINEALEKYFAIESTNESLDLTKQIIDKSIETHLKKYFERIIALESKNTKTNYSSIYLLANLLAVLYQTDDERNFIQEKIKLADELRI